MQHRFENSQDNKTVNSTVARALFFTVLNDKQSQFV